MIVLPASSSVYRGCESFESKCEEKVPPVTTADHRYALCLKSPLKSVSTSARHNSKTIELLP